MDLQNILTSSAISKDDKENAILEYSKFLLKNENFEELQNICLSLNIFWKDLTNARSSKILKRICLLITNYKKGITFLDNLIEKSKNKKYLKLFLETKKVSFYFELKEYEKCLENIKKLDAELKKMNDKVNLISLHLVESKTHFMLKNMVKAKACLTSARALSVTTYTPFEIQGQIELLSGIYICEENYHESSHSNFIEALDNFTQAKMHKESSLCVRFLILSKMVLNNFSQIYSLFKNKNILPFQKDEIVIKFLKLSECCKNKNLASFENELKKNFELKNENLEENFVISQLNLLKNNLLEANILKLISPYLNINISFIAEKLNFSVAVIEEKLRFLILDQKISGILDYYTNTLILFEKENLKENEKNNLEMISKICNFIESE